VVFDEWGEGGWWEARGSEVVAWRRWLSEYKMVFGASCMGEGEVC
jgi:hypothetical protein